MEMELEEMLKIDTRDTRALELQLREAIATAFQVGLVRHMAKRYGWPPPELPDLSWLEEEIATILERLLAELHTGS